MKKASLVDESEYFGLRDSFLAPIVGPIVENMLSNVPSRVARTEQKLFCFAADENQAQIYLICWDMPARHDLQNQSIQNP